MNINQDDIFCDSCGMIVIADDGQAVDYPQVKNVSCGECGTKIAEDETFCMFCTTPVSSGASQLDRQPSAKHMPPLYPSPETQPLQSARSQMTSQSGNNQQAFVKKIATLTVCIAVVIIASVLLINRANCSESDSSEMDDFFLDEPEIYAAEDEIFQVTGQHPDTGVYQLEIRRNGAPISDIWINSGDTEKLYALTPRYDANITWTSSDSNIFSLSIDFDGRSADIFGINNGTAVLTVTDGFTTNTISVNVGAYDFQENLHNQLGDAVLNTNDWVRIDMVWTSGQLNGRTTVFERDRNSPHWRFLSAEDGSSRLIEPSFSYNGDAIAISVPFTTNQYLLYGNRTGGLGDLSFTWTFSTDSSHSIGALFGTGQTTGLYDAVIQYPIVSIHVAWQSGEQTVFYKCDNGSWRFASSSKTIRRIDPPQIDNVNGTVLLECVVDGYSYQYEFQSGGTGAVDDDRFNWFYNYLA